MALMDRGERYAELERLYSHTYRDWLEIAGLYLSPKHIAVTCDNPEIVKVINIFLAANKIMTKLPTYHKRLLLYGDLFLGIKTTTVYRSIPKIVILPNSTKAIYEFGSFRKLDGLTVQEPKAFQVKNGVHVRHLTGEHDPYGTSVFKTNLKTIEKTLAVCQENMLKGLVGLCVHFLDHMNMHDSFTVTWKN